MLPGYRNLWCSLACRINRESLGRENFRLSSKVSSLYDWMNKTYIEKLDEYFNDEDLKYLMSALLGYVGTEPEKTPASSALPLVFPITSMEVTS